MARNGIFPDPAMAKSLDQLVAESRDPRTVQQQVQDQQRENDEQELKSARSDYEFHVRNHSADTIMRAARIRYERACAACGVFE